MNATLSIPDDETQRTLFVSARHTSASGFYSYWIVYHCRGCVDVIVSRGPVRAIYKDVTTDDLNAIASW